MTTVVPAEGSGGWRSGLFGCFENCGLCIKTFFCPCLVFGSTAAAVGKSKCLWTCYVFIPIWNLLKAVQLRQEIREQSGIAGGCVGDCLTTIFCGGCSLIQEAKQVSGGDGQAMAIERE